MTTETRHRALWETLRIGAAMCFVGHGAFGIITKAEWLPFFDLVGIPDNAAYVLMPIIGFVDIALGLSLLIAPTRAVLLYMGIWALWTAALRPLSGLPVLEMLERAGNYGVPLAFLAYVGWPQRRAEWFTSLRAGETSGERQPVVWRILLVTTVVLLVGHAGLALSQKDVLLQHAAAIGFGPGGLMAVGGSELALAAGIVLAPQTGLFVAIAAWKVATEALWPMSGAPVWEFIERGGSYAAPLALAVLATGRTPLRLATRALTPAIGLIALLVPVAASAGQDATPQMLPPSALIDSLRAGGFSLACRHAITDHSRQDFGPARDQQRNLSPAGEAQARAIGDAVRRLGIRFGDVRANPMFRNQETATLAFGSMHVDSSLGGRSASQGLRALLQRPVPRGTNVAIVTRIGILSGALSKYGLRNPSEGDCYVVRRLDDAEITLLGRIRSAEWDPSATADGVSPAAPVAQAQAQIRIPENASVAARTYFLADFAVLRGKLEALAEAIPEEKFTWRPSEGARSFAEVFQHVAGDHYGGVMMVFGVHRDTIAVALAEARGLTPTSGKADIIRILKQSSASVRQSVAGVDSVALLAPLSSGAQRNVLRASINMTAELHEHLGQLIAYARSVGLVPPWSNF